MVDVLLADDDETSRRFLQEALETLGYTVHACADGESALAEARRRPFALLMLDCRMPGAGALQVLTSLRRDAAAASRSSVAVATSAEVDAALKRHMAEAGFAAVLAKPLSVADLDTALRPLAQSPGGERPLLDDAVALHSSGDAQTVRALRGLFVAELQRLRSELDALAAEPGHLAARLHPLLASCGFCGATALSERVMALKRALDTPVDTDTALRAFRASLDATLAALSGTNEPT